MIIEGKNKTKDNILGLCETRCWKELYGEWKEGSTVAIRNWGRIKECRRNWIMLRERAKHIDHLQYMWASPCPNREPPAPSKFMSLDQQHFYS